MKREIDIQAIIDSCRADTIPVGDAGLWYVKKWETDQDLRVQKNGRWITVEAGCYTNLHRWTDATIHLGEGELVMTDMEDELVTHLDFILKAKGKVLVTGLGLGCVVRGLLGNPNVESVTVIENSKDVMALVADHMPKDPKLIIVVADAHEWCAKYGRNYDSVWHDIWTDTGAGEPVLALAHSKLIVDTFMGARVIGAWAFPRKIRRLYRTMFAGKGNPIQFI